MSATVPLTSNNDQQAKACAKASDKANGYQRHAGTFLGLVRNTSHATSGLRSSQTTFPEVAFSIDGQCSAGTLPRCFHIAGELSETPIVLARADALPKTLIAFSSAVMFGSSVITFVIMQETPT